MKAKTTKIQRAAIGMNDCLLEQTHEMNTVLTQSKRISPVFQGHFFNMGTGRNGIAGLVEEILLSKGAFFPLSILEASIEQQTQAKACCLTSDQIIAEVQTRFAAGSTRYNPQSVKVMLSTKFRQKGIVATFNQTSDEDSSRHADKNGHRISYVPRLLWFWVKQ